MRLVGLKIALTTHNPSSAGVPLSNDKENDYKCVEPTFLVSEEGAPIMCREEDSLKKKSGADAERNRGKRGLRRHSGARSHVDTLMEHTEDDKEEEQKGMFLAISHLQRGSLADRFSLVCKDGDKTSPASPKELNLESSKTSSQKELQQVQTLERYRYNSTVCQPRVMLTAIKHFVTKDSGRLQKVCLIQARFRGYLARIQLREWKLRKKLQEIERRKEIELEVIEVSKCKEMCAYHAKIFIRPIHRKEEVWQSKHEIVTKLLSNIRMARKKHSKLQKQLARWKNVNKNLALTNSSLLLSTGKEKRRVNRIERCGLQLFDVARAYREALMLGRQTKRDFDVSTGLNMELQARRATRANVCSREGNEASQGSRGWSYRL